MVLCILSKCTTFQNSHFSEQPTSLRLGKASVLNIAGSSMTLERAAGLSEGDTGWESRKKLGNKGQEKRKKKKLDIIEQPMLFRGLESPNQKGWETPVFLLQTLTEGSCQN